MTEMLCSIDWAGLPKEEQETISTIGSLIVEGYSLSEIARRTGRPETQVASAVASLREALLVRAGELEPQLRERVESLRRRTSTA